MPTRLLVRLVRPVLPGLLLSLTLAATAGGCSDADLVPPLRSDGSTSKPPKRPGPSSSTPAESEGPPSGGAPAEPQAPPGAGAPTLSSVSPDAVTLGTVPEGLELTLTGSRFADGQQVDLAGTTLPATVKSSTEMTVRVPADKTLASGVFRIAIVAGASAQSNPLTFTVANPTSVSIATLSPQSAIIGAINPVTLSVTGAGFTPQSVVRFNGASLTTTFTSGSALSATIPASAFIDAGRVGVTVSNGVDVVSLPTSFEVRNPAPQATTLSPRTATAGAAAMTVTLDGSGFTRTSEIVAAGTPLVTTFVGATRLQATLPANLLTTARTLTVSARTPGPGGGTSGGQSFTVQAAGGDTGGGGVNPACLYKCVDYNYSPGQCYMDWYCIPTGEYAGCLGQTTC
ncbi:MAG: hypothetical protein KF819_09620 [Labilithrix sp.]|nr:hypothetical protein [Labilithrix sp.]